MKTLTFLFLTHLNYLIVTNVESFGNGCIYKGDQYFTKEVKFPCRNYSYLDSCYKYQIGDTIKFKK